MANLTPHNEAALGDFAKTVLMPGDRSALNLSQILFFKTQNLSTMSAVFTVTREHTTA